MSKEYLEWAVKEAKADVVFLNFGHWWYARHLGNGFERIPAGHQGQVLLAAYEEVFYFGNQLKNENSSYSHVDLVFKTTTMTRNESIATELYDKLEPMLQDLAKFYGWRVFDTRSVTKHALVLKDYSFFMDVYHMTPAMNEMLNDFLYAFLC